MGANGRQPAVDEFGRVILEPAGKVHPRERGELTSDERRRLSELERENARLRRERDILKAAAALFASEAGTL